MTTPKEGDLRVWWCPQVPIEAFMVPVASPEESARVLAMFERKRGQLASAYLLTKGGSYRKGS